MKHQQSVKKRTLLGFKKVQFLTVLLFVGILLLGTKAYSQTYYSVTNLSGTSLVDGITVTVTSSGSISSYTCGSAGPYWEGSGSVGSYTWSFSSPVNTVKFDINYSNIGDDISFKINGTSYPLSSSQVTALSECDASSTLIVSGGNLVYTGSTYSYGSATVTINTGSSINSVTLQCLGGGSGVTNDCLFAVGFTNVAPSFTNGASATLNACMNGSSNISSLLSILDANSGQTETYNVVTAPVNGTLSGFPDSITSTGSIDTPTGFIYTPTTGFTGNDSFQVMVNDGHSGMDTIMIYVTVNPIPTVSAIGSQAVCNGLHTATVNFSGSVTGTSFSWTNNNIHIGLAATGTGAIDSFIATNDSLYIDTAIIVVTPNYNGCMGASQSFTISVNPTPTIDSIANQILCNTFATTTVHFTGLVSGTSYTWTNNNTTIGLGASGADSINTFTATDTTNVFDTAIITVTPMANTCSGNAKSFSIIVKPTPSVTIPSTMFVCNGSSMNVLFTGSVSGTTYNWTNSDTTFGLVSTGIDSIATYVARDTTTAIDTAIITVTPNANTCIGTAKTFLIIANPTPTVTTPANQVICNGAATTLVNFSGAVAGTVYNWTNNDSLIGLSARGVGNISSFSAIDTSANTIDTATIWVTPSINACPGTAHSFLYIVNPSPKVNAVSSQTKCNDSSTLAITFTGSVTGSAFTWVNNDTTIGLTSHGIGNISSFVTSDTSSVIDTATITVTPHANGCAGASKSFMIIVNPTPKTVAPTIQTVCNNTSTTKVMLSGNVAASTFMWTSIDTLSGLASNGVDSINSFLVINGSTAPITDSITVIAWANGCPGLPQTFTVLTINPTPALSSNLRDTVCSESHLNYTPNSATTGTSYTWHRATTTHITPSGLGGTASVSETLVNDTLVPVNVTYVYTLTANSCVNSQNVVVRVNPTPPVVGITTHSPSNLCSNTLYQNFGTSTLPLLGEQFTWSAVNASVWASGINHQYSIVNFPTSGNSSVILSVNMTGISCYKRDTFAVTVGTETSALPTVAYLNSQFVCLLNDQDSYQWGYDDNTTLDSTLLPGETNQFYYQPSPATNKDYWVITKKGDCMQKTYSTTPTQAINLNTNIDNIKVYPNPATQELNVTITGNLEYTNVKVFDLLGKELLNAPIIDNNAKINVSQLAPGIYLLSSFMNGTSVKTIRFTKN